jgi:hypothetical protein
MPDVREAMNHKGVWAVVCANFDEVTGCDIRPMTAWYLPEGDKDGKTRAIEAWNRRPDNLTCSQGHDMRG